MSGQTWSVWFPQSQVLPRPGALATVLIGKRKANAGNYKECRGRVRHTVPAPPYLLYQLPRSQGPKAPPAFTLTGTARSGVSVPPYGQQRAVQAHSEASEAEQMSGPVSPDGTQGHTEDPPHPWLRMGNIINIRSFSSNVSFRGAGAWLCSGTHLPEPGMQMFSTQRNVGSACVCVV